MLLLQPGTATLCGNAEGVRLDFERLHSFGESAESKMTPVSGFAETAVEQVTVCAAERNG